MEIILVGMIMTFVAGYVLGIIVMTDGDTDNKYYK